MTEQQIDLDRLRRGAESALACGTFDAEVMSAVPHLLDQLDQAEAELESWMTRAYEAEKRAWKAEKRLAGWMEHWNATARTGAVDEVAAVLEANARADQAEARIRAVEDVLNTAEDGHSTDPVIRGLFPRMVGTALVRRALDGDA